MKHLTLNNAVVALSALWCLAFYGALVVQHAQAISFVLHVILAIFGLPALITWRVMRGAQQ